MALRKASAYSKRRVVPYTRKSKSRRKSYIKTVPPQKIVKFKMGDAEGYRKGKFPYMLEMVSDENVQIRDNALEACRQFINKKLDKQFSDQYYFEIKVIPHHILRENKMLTTAGADRMQTGMQLAFGKAVGRAAIVKKGKSIFVVAGINERVMRSARKLFHEIRSKLPCKTRILMRHNETTGQ